MILTDIHTHSTFSADADSPLAEMVAAARAMGVRYFGISEHFDYDYPPAGLTYSDGAPAHTDEQAYFTAARAIQAQSDANFVFLAGCELGYTDDPASLIRYMELIEKYSPDFVVNSVHTCDGADCWYGEYFSGKSKEKAYSRYLRRVLQSLLVQRHSFCSMISAIACGVCPSANASSDSRMCRAEASIFFSPVDRPRSCSRAERSLITCATSSRLPERMCSMFSR